MLSMRAIFATSLMLLVMTGCPKKATYLPNDHGGYTLMTKAGSIEQAVTRFQRTAKDICGTRPFTLGMPVTTDRGWGLFGSATTVQSDLTCQ